MQNIEQDVQAHYAVDGLAQSIYEALHRQGADPSAIGTVDLAPVDAFHIRGREATVQLAGVADLRPGEKVLDIGSGIGGTARYLAAEHGCSVTGIDLTREYCETATELSARVGLSGRTSFRQASALELPFHDETFDVVWTEHVQMNIADKRRFYAEAVRVLQPGGRLVFHDIFAGPGGATLFPVPWASTAELSFLAPVDAVRDILADLGLSLSRWIDSSDASRAWFQAAMERSAAQGGPPPLSLHLLMGSTGRDKFNNVLQNLIEKAGRHRARRADQGVRPMGPELRDLAILALFTSMMWVPYIHRPHARPRCGCHPRQSTCGRQAPAPDWARRAKAAHANAVENLIVFAALVMVAQGAGVHTDVTALATTSYVWIRVAHFFVYTAGVPVVRTLAFVGGWVCQVMLAVEVLVG